MRVLLTGLLLGLSAVGPAAAQSCRTVETEPNDSQGQANAGLCSGQAVNGSIASRRDQDWYRLDLGAAGTISVSLSHDTASDFDWYLYGSSGSTVASGTSSQVPETGSYAPPAAGTYYLHVVRYRGTGAYAVTASFPAGGGGGSGCSYGTRPAKPGGLKSWLTGSAADACRPLTGPGLLLMGGGPDVDEAFSGRIRPALAGGDVVVIRTSGSNGYNEYLYGVLAADSVETLLVDTVTKANAAYVDWAVRSADFVWIAGGDQSDYLDRWQGTALQQAVRHVYDKGGLVGGTSAGLAVLGDVIYDPDGVTAVISSEAVTDPCHPSILLSEHFLDLPLLGGIVADTHFEARDRMGRLLTFMARIGGGTLLPTRQPITGIGVDEATSLFLDKAGQGVVDGQGAAYVLREDAGTTRTQVACGRPVVYSGVRRYRLTRGDTFDFPTGQSSVGPWTIGIDGRQASFYSPSDPY